MSSFAMIFAVLLCSVSASCSAASLEASAFASSASATRGQATTVAEAGASASGPRAYKDPGLHRVLGTVLLVVDGETLGHACIDSCIRAEPLGAGPAVARMWRAASLGREAPIRTAPVPAPAPEEGLRLFWHARGVRSSSRHAGLWALVGATLVGLLCALPGAWGREVVGTLCSSAVALRRWETCAEVCLVGLVCVPILGVLSALPYAMAAACWALCASRGLWYLLACVSEAVFAARWFRGIRVARQRCWTPLRTLAVLRTLAEFWSRGAMEAWLAAAVAAPFLLPSCGVHLGECLCVLCSLVNLAVLCPSRCVGLLLLCEALRPTYGPKAPENKNPRAAHKVKHNTKNERHTSEQR